MTLNDAPPPENERVDPNFFHYGAENYRHCGAMPQGKKHQRPPTVEEIAAVLKAREGTTLSTAYKDIYRAVFRHSYASDIFVQLRVW